MSTEIRLGIDEIERQRGYLAELRQEQSAVIVSSGLAQRAIDATTYGRQGEDLHEPYTDTTLFYPLRQRLGQQRVSRTKDIIAATGIEQDEHFGDTLFSLMGTTEDPTYAYLLGRVDIYSKASYRSRIYSLGLRLAESTGQTGMLDVFRPVKGLTKRDLVFSEKLLATVANKSVEQNLSILDPESLGEDPKVVGWF